MRQRTLGIIKPDAVQSGYIGEILAIYEKEGFKILAMKMLKLTMDQARAFYEVHKERPFYDDLCRFMSSGPCVAMVLEAEDAVQKNRELMGATDPAEAAEGTIRKRFARNKQENAVHGSDSPENADKEIRFFFSELEICAS